MRRRGRLSIVSSRSLRMYGDAGYGNMSAKVRIDDELYNEIKKIAEKSGKSIRDVVEEALRAYLLGKAQVSDRDIKSVKEKWIAAKFASKCSLCGKEINQGELVYWVRIEYEDGSAKSFVYCSDCYYRQFDKALAKKFLKEKELKAVIRGLEKEANELAEKVNKLKQEYDILKLKEEVFKLYKEFHEFLGDAITSDEKLAKVNEFLERLQDIVDRVSRLESSLMFTAEKPRPRAKRRSEAYAL